MLKLQGNKVYLATLEREDCRKLWNDTEYDSNNITEMLNIGYSVEKADEWFDEIQKLQGKVHIRLGIFLNEADEPGKNTVIGDIALQDIDTRNNSCTIGYGLSRLEYRNHGYMTEAVKLMLSYGFNQYGFERISARILEQNAPSRRILEKCGFSLEGGERSAVYFGGRRYDMLIYGLLRWEYLQIKQ